MFEKKDLLNRVIYRQINDVERFIYKYYGKTNVLKIKIRLVCKEQIVELFDKKGKIIYSDENRNQILKLKNLIISKNQIRIKLPAKVKQEYMKNLRLLLNQKNKIKK